MKCLIIAAGKGSRLQSKFDCKPLIPVLGVPLIERVIRSAMEAGVYDFYVVVGYEGERVRKFLDSLSERLSIPITVILNEDWKKENGWSVLKAKEYLKEPFYLLMADHLFEPDIIRRLEGYRLKEGEIVLGVDENLENGLIDMDDVTRVEFDEEKINGIGKNLEKFNGFDTGIFRCTPALFQAIEHSSASENNTTLSGAVQMLAYKDAARTVSIGDNFWIDVDDPKAFKKAEKVLLKKLRTEKHNDGPVARYLNRPLSIAMSRFLVRTRITPNQISIFSFFVSLVGAGLFFIGGRNQLILGGFLAQFASVVDGCDGEVARLKFQSSQYGAWLDAVLDRYADAFLLFGLTWYEFQANANENILWIGFLAIIGSFMLSYSADKFDNMMKNRIDKFGGIRIGRDIRIFLIFLGALFNQITITLVIIAAVMNVETLRRLVICRDNDE